MIGRRKREPATMPETFAASARERYAELLGRVPEDQRAGVLALAWELVSESAYSPKAAVDAAVCRWVRGNGGGGN